MRFALRDGVFVFVNLHPGEEFAIKREFHRCYIADSGAVWKAMVNGERKP